MFFLSLCSHIVKQNGSQMSVSVCGFVWLQEETREAETLLQSFCACTRAHAVHIEPGKLHAHAEQKSDLRPDTLHQLSSRDEELEGNRLVHRNHSHTEPFEVIIYADLVQR